MGRNVNVAVVAVGMALAAPVAHAQQGISPRQGEGLLADLVRRGVPAQEAREGLESLAAAVPRGNGRVSRLPSGLTLRVIVDNSRVPGFQGCRIASVNFVQAPANASYSAVWCPRPDGLEAQQGSGEGSVVIRVQQSGPEQQPVPPQRTAQYGEVPNRLDVAERMDEVRVMRVRTPLYEQPVVGSRNLGNLIENTKVHMTGHLPAVPGWVRIEVGGKLGYSQESNLLPFTQEQQASPAQPSTPIPPAIAAAPEAMPIPAPRQAAAPVMPVPATPQQPQAAPLIAGPAALPWARELTGEVPRQPAPPPPPVQAAQQPPAPPRVVEAPQQPVPAPAPVVASPAAPVVPAPVVTAAPAAPAQPAPQRPPAPVAQAAPTPPPAPAPPARKPVDSSL